MKIPNVIQPDPTNKELLYFRCNTIRVCVIVAAEPLIIDRWTAERNSWLQRHYNKTPSDKHRMKTAR